VTRTGGDPLGALPAGLGREGLVEEVGRALGWLASGARVGLAVSGGADSVTLAHLVRAARPDLDAVVLHVRHGLRDDGPATRAASAAAASLGLEFVEVPVTVRADRRTGVEAAARDARLDAFARVAGERGLEAVLLAHTADDQAETVLLNLGRGSGIAGLAGMRARRGHGGVTLARPLLRARRADVRGLARDSGWAWDEDPMNVDPRRRRTRARFTLLPALDSLSGGSGDAVALLSRLADLARDDAEVLDALAAGHAASDVVAWGPVRCVRVERLHALPTGLARRVVRLVLAGVRGGTAGLGSAAVEAALRLGPGQAVDISGGVRATCGSGWLTVAPAELPPLARRALPETGGGCVPLPELGLRLRVGAVGGAPGRATVVPPGVAGGPAPPRHASGLLPASCRAGVRGWRAGDRIRTVHGEESLAARLSRAGVPRAVRGLFPVVVDESDRLLWVAGLAGGPPVGDGGRPVWLEAGLG
jgi:tRNA(Ile)-lysidine synthase